MLLTALALSTLARDHSATPYRLALEALTPLPDASGSAGRGAGFSATGLAFDPITGGWVVGNDGRAQDPQRGHDPSLVFLDATGVMVRELRLAPLYPGHGSVQGVAIDPHDGDIWYAARNDNLIRKIDRADGAERARLTWPAPNGLFVDADASLWILTDDAVAHVSSDGVLLRRFTIARGDGLTREGARLWVANDDRLEAYDARSGALIARFGLNGINYAEGLSICGERLWLIHNGAYHRTSRRPAAPGYSALARYVLPQAVQGGDDACARARRFAFNTPGRP